MSANPLRILIVDDNTAIHDDFRKLFAAERPKAAALDDLESSLFGETVRNRLMTAFEFEFATQGEQALELVVAAKGAGRPFAMGFVDGRMPPGWDGVETIERLWQADPDLQVVICTAYSDYTWDDIRKRLGNSDGLLVLKKPFDTVEVLQMAHTLTRKWELTRQVRASIEELDRKVAERTAALECEMANRARVEEQLRQSQKLDAVGQLAAGIAHDFNNLLTVIQGNTGLLLSATGSVPTSKEPLKQIACAADRAAALTRQLLVFSRQQVEQARPLDLNRVLTGTSGLLRRIIGEQIQVLVAPAPVPAGLVADESNLVQVIMNLVINARDAMADGGQLTLRSSLETFTREMALLHPKSRPGAFVCLTVADTGCGMDPITLSRIFEPFFTTKGVGKGTGLGLATVYGIVRQYDGWIEVISERGRGTTFKVYLPHLDEPVPATGQTEFAFKHPPEPTRRGTVLLVEDEPGVREFVRTILVAHSYDVLEATDGAAAIEIWGREAAQIDLLFTDMVMPNGITGRGLAERLRADRSDLKVVYSSGYSAETIGAEWLTAPGVGFLPKPYSADALLRSIGAMFQTPARKAA